MKIFFPVFILMLLLPGCAFTPQANTPLAVYSLGTRDIPFNPADQAIIKPTSIFVADATSSKWLDSQAIQYRLAYHNPMQIYRYVNSRWAATPAAMLTQQIRSRMLEGGNIRVIKPGDGAQADYALQIELTEFSQVFDSTDSSHAVISLSASLIKRKSRLLIAQQNFNIQHKTASADATGAVFAFNDASLTLTKDVTNWIAKEIADHYY